MSEQLNQVENLEVTNVVDEIDFDFDDQTSETNHVDDSTQTETQDNQEASVDESEGKESDFLEVVYNGEHIKVTKEEAIQLTQKGLNYDKVQENFEKLRSSKEFQMLNDMARQSGLSPVEYLERLNQFQNQSQINQVYTQLKERYPDAPEEVLKQNAQNFVNQKLQEKEQQEYQLQQMEEQKQNEFANQQIEMFFEKFPDADIKNLPAEVIDGIRQGTPLVTAYQDYEIKRLRKEMETTKLNIKNKESTPGSVSENQSDPTAMDSFLQGLMM